MKKVSVGRFVLPFVVVVAHHKGGVGKSTIASNLAVAFAEEYGEDFQAIDVDNQGSLMYFNAVRQENGRPALPIKRVDFKDKNAASILTNLINENKGLLLIDAGGFDSDINRLVLMGADRIITPVSESGIELAGLQRFQDAMKEVCEQRGDGIKATVLLNNVHIFATGKSLDEIFTFARNENEFDIFETIVRDRGEIRKAFDEGISVLEVAGSKAAQEIKQLIGELTNG